MTPYAELASVAESIPLLVRERRRYLGMSQRATARHLRVSFSTISRIEAGEDYNSRLLPDLLRWLGGAETVREGAE